MQPFSMGHYSTAYVTTGFPKLLPRGAFKQLLHGKSIDHRHNMNTHWHDEEYSRF